MKTSVLQEIIKLESLLLDLCINYYIFPKITKMLGCKSFESSLPVDKVSDIIDEFCIDCQCKV